MSITILGISALYHDSAAAVIRDGEIIAAAQEERFTRKKADASIPVHAIDYCLKAVNEQIDQVVYYDNPLLTIDRWLSNCTWFKGGGIPDNKKLIEKSYGRMTADRIWIHRHLKNVLGDRWPEDTELMVCEHHVSHAASAFYPSPFKESAILTMDGVGEWATTTIGKGSGNKLCILEQINYPESIGLLYSAFTYFCGFKVNFGEYKLMGLAPYGEPIYADLIRSKLVTVEDDGRFKLNQKYFTYTYDDRIVGEEFGKLFGMQKREPESPLSKPYMDLAASIQVVTEEIVLKLARHARELTGCSNLTLAGGIALNCVANGKIIKEGIFDNIWIQPAAGDAGGALGCALYAAYNKFGVERTISQNGKDAQKGSYLGPKYSNAEIKKFLDEINATYHYYETDEIYDVIAAYIANDKVVGLHQGRMEYGPRALGNRSIIASALSAEMQSKLNLKIKFRESFRPFAPAVLEERLQDYFDLSVESPYMLVTAPVKEELRLTGTKQSIAEDIYSIINRKRSTLPAITHVDYSARIQSVTEDTNPYFYYLLKAFEKRTGYGVVVNTSFNVRGEPIVCSPADSWRCFMRTDMDVLVLENYILLKEEQEELNEEKDWRNVYELD